MAVRKDGLHSERVRARIQLSQLVTRLQKNGLGELEMTASQVDSAKFLVNKAMPNLPERSDVNLTGNLSIEWPVAQSSLDRQTTT
jgi:hypothetical protein